MESLLFVWLFYFLVLSIVAIFFMMAIANGSPIAALAMTYAPVSPVFGIVAVVSLVIALISWFVFGFNPWPALWDWVTPGS